MKTLKDLFLEELADVYDAELRIVKALPKMQKAASSEELKKAIESHLKETEGHVKKVEQVFGIFDEKAKAKTCDAAVGLLKEGEKMAAAFKGSQSLDAALICSLQKVEHYEIATYGCLLEWAEIMENEKAAAILQKILGQEKAANESLTELARAGSNEEAMSGSEAEAGSHSR